MGVYTVAVEGRSIEYYEVKADSEEEARQNWASGTQESIEVLDSEVTNVVFEYDDEDDLYDEWDGVYDTYDDDEEEPQWV